jgi:hypothetical protein
LQEIIKTMFGLFKKKKKESESYQGKAEEYNFKWYDVGESNPFNKRILDIRSLTQTMLSFTSDKEVAVLFNKQRRSIGEELIDIKLNDSKILPANLEYSHNGSKMEGAGYKAKCMEDKWDIYFWNGIMYLTRSWTGEVVYKAHINFSETNFTITKIEYSENEFTQADPSLAIDNVHFIILSHAFGRPFPHRIPKTLINEKDIALYSFNQFGHNCWYATYDTILDAIVIPKRTE